MKRFTKLSSFIGGGAMAVLLFDGCLLEKASIHYAPQPNVASVAGTDRVSIKLEVVDARVLRDRIGEVSYGRGFSVLMGTRRLEPVAAGNDPVQVLKQAVEGELTRRGFRLSDAGIPLQVQLNSIYCRFRSVGEPDGARAKTAITAIIRNNGGSVSYNNLFTGEADVPNIQNANSGIALDNALQNCLAQLFANPSFINALLNAPGSHQNSG